MKGEKIVRTLWFQKFAILSTYGVQTNLRGTADSRIGYGTTSSLFVTMAHYTIIPYCYYLHSAQKGEEIGQSFTLLNKNGRNYVSTVHILHLNLDERSKPAHKPFHQLFLWEIKAQSIVRSFSNGV
jgi:hypothetical protein